MGCQREMSVSYNGLAKAKNRNIALRERKQKNLNQYVFSENKHACLDVKIQTNFASVYIFVSFYVFPSVFDSHSSSKFYFFPLITACFMCFQLPFCFSIV